FEGSEPDPSADHADVPMSQHLTFASGAADSYRLSFVFHDLPTAEIYTLSLHDALPIYTLGIGLRPAAARSSRHPRLRAEGRALRSEEHTSELQSRRDLVCRLLLEKKKNVAKQCEAAQPVDERLDRRPVERAQRARGERA